VCLQNQTLFNTNDLQRLLKKQCHLTTGGPICYTYSESIAYRIIPYKIVGA